MKDCVMIYENMKFWPYDGKCDGLIYLRNAIYTFWQINLCFPLFLQTLTDANVTQDVKLVL